MRSSFVYFSLTLVVLAAVLFSPVAGLLQQDFSKSRKTIIEHGPVFEIAGNFEYQWEDSESHTISASGWERSPSAINPPGRNNRNVLWLRTRMPDIKLKAPAILIDGRGILLAFDMFINDKKIYQFGRLDASGKGGVTGLSAHFIRLEDAYAGQMLCFRIFSDYSNIGVRGKIFLGSKSDLVQKVMKDDILYFVVALFIISIGILDLVIYKNSILTIGSVSMTSIFAISLGFYTITTTTLKDFIFFAPAFWFLIYIAGLSLIPVGLIGFLWQVFRPVYGNFYHRIWQFHLGYSFVCQITTLMVLKGFLPMKAGVIELTILRILTAFELILMVSVCISDMVRLKSRLAGIYFLGFLPVIVTGIHSILVGLGILNYAYSFVPLALIIFILSLEVVQRRRNISLHEQLQTYAGELEIKSGEKLELIKDLHDGIGGSVTNIKFISQMGMNSGSEQEMKKSLSAISEMSGNCMTEIGHFMQSLDENEISWDSLTAKMIRLGETKLKPLGISVTFNTDINPKQQNPGSVLYLNLLRIFQEALTNIVKHADAQNVFITIRITGHHILMEIQDDGIGAAVGTRHGKPTGKGLANMQARARKLNGSCVVESGNGTIVKVELMV